MKRADELQIENDLLRKQLKDANDIISAAKDLVNNGEGFALIEVYCEEYEVVL